MIKFKSEAVEEVDLGFRFFKSVCFRFILDVKCSSAVEMIDSPSFVLSDDKSALANDLFSDLVDAFSLSLKKFTLVSCKVGEV